jgi:rhodanese-related sulfurtransferase
MRNITPVELKSYLEQSDRRPLLLDVREPWEFECCHIDGSVLVPMRAIATEVSELDPERETVVICHHGVRSRFVARSLEHCGFRRVLNLAGGVDAWARDVDKTMAIY